MNINEWKLFWRTLNRIINKFKKRYTIVTFTGLDEELKPTQRDKPSPHSSLTLIGTLHRLNKIFPDTQYIKSYVANTNSMEPLIDDNCIVVLEKLGMGVLDRQPLVIGDIAIYEGIIKGKKYNIMHQIIKVSDNGTQFKFKGINNYFADGWIDDVKVKWRLNSINYCRAMREND